MPSQLQKQQCYLVYGNNFKPVKKKVLNQNIVV